MDWDLNDVEGDAGALLPDPDGLWAMVERLGLMGFYLDTVVANLTAAQHVHFGPGGALHGVGDDFWVDPLEIERILVKRERDIVWSAWEGWHAGQVNGDLNHQTWDSPVAWGDAAQVQVVRYPEGKMAYNVTYVQGDGRAGCHAGYDRKQTRDDGVHVGFGRQRGGRSVIVWLLPREAFLEVVGPDAAHGRRRTALSSNGHTWGNWEVRNEVLS